MLLGHHLTLALCWLYPMADILTLLLITVILSILFLMTKFCLYYCIILSSQLLLGPQIYETSSNSPSLRKKATAEYWMISVTHFTNVFLVALLSSVLHVILRNNPWVFCSYTVYPFQLDLWAYILSSLLESIAPPQWCPSRT